MKYFIAVLLTFTLYSGSSEAGFSEKAAASFAAKYDVCSKRLRDKRGYKIRSLKMKVEADRIGRRHVGNGYIVAFVRESKKAWLLPLRRCKKIAKRF